MTGESVTDRQRTQSSEAGENRSIGSRLIPDVIRGRLIAKVAVAILVILLLTAGISAYYYFGISDQFEGQVDGQVE